MITLQSPGEILFSIGHFSLHWYGFIIALGFLVALGVVLHEAKRQNIPEDRIINLSTLLLLGCIACARLYYVIFNWDYFSGHFAEAFMIWHGGLSIHGVIIGGFLMMMAYTKLNNLKLLQYTDLYAYGLILGQAIGRWGNFFNSEAFGKPTEFFLNVYIPPENRPEGYAEFEYFHPTFLYESVWNLFVFFILFFVLRKRFPGKHGVITCSYLILYSAGRFFIEGLRLDNIYSVGGLHIAQFTSLLLIGAAITGLIVLYWGWRHNHAKQS